MKKFLFTLTAATTILASCNSGNGFKITGKIEGKQEGNVYLFALNNMERDTLAKSPITKGAFTLTGKADSLEIAYLSIEGLRGSMPIFIENGTFELNIDINNPQNTELKGGVKQTLANQFTDIHKAANQEAMKLNQLYQQAMSANDNAKIDSIETVFNKLGQEIEEKEDALIKANPDSPVAAYMIASNTQGEVEKLKTRFALLGEKAKNSTFGKEIAERIQKLEITAIGQIAPDFTITTPEDTSISLSDIKGKVKLIDFWASWCGPCRGENPNVVAIYKEYHPKGLEIFGVSLDDNKEQWIKAIEDDGLIWKHGSDLKGWQSDAAQLYMVNAIPHTILLDENNRIVAKNLRGEELKAKIVEMLK